MNAHDKASNELIADPGMCDNGSSSSFEFPKGDRATLKPAPAAGNLRLGPSKWNDAEKWLANPHHYYSSRPKVVPLHAPAPLNPSKQSASYSMKDGVSTSTEAFLLQREECASFSMPPGQETDFHQQGANGGISNGCVGESNSFAFPAPPSKVRSTNTFDFYPLQDEPSDMKELSISHEGVNDDTLLKPTEPPAWDRAAYIMPEPALRSVSMRDMGTEMTPIASQEPSRTGTPIQATTPLRRSPVSSGSSTPQRAAPASSPLQAPEDPIQSSGNISTPDNDTRASEPAGENDMQMKTRKDIQTLGVQLGRINIVAWASKEDEDGDSSKLLKNIDLEEVKKNVLETRAAAWEEAKQAKYMARLKREEAKIQAWENHERAKAEAEMRRIEVKIEKIRSHAHEKLMNKLAAAKRRAEERRAAAEAKRGEQAAKTVAHANHIRRTGRMPSPILGCAFCPGDL
eukprot:c23842_g1_i1 orf=878-2251(+)